MAYNPLFLMTVIRKWNVQFSNDRFGFIPVWMFTNIAEFPFPILSGYKSTRRDKTTPEAGQDIVAVEAIR